MPTRDTQHALRPRSPFVLLAALVLAPVPGVTGEPKLDVAGFDALVAGTVERFGLAGAAVAVIDDGEVVLAKGYGHADCESGAPVTTNTRFNIGSVSKLVAAWGVMRLVDQGLVELDAPVWKYVHTWKLPESEYDANGVTVRRLLSHTAGLTLHGYPGFALDQPLPTLPESLSGATNGAGSVSLYTEPGTGLRYSGGGFTLLQLLCEELTERPFADFMREACFVPLGMPRTGFNREPRLEQDTARPHGLLRDPLPDRAFRAEAAAAAYTTLDDFVRFALAHFDLGPEQPAGRSVLSPAAVARLGTPVDETGGKWAHGAMVLGGSGDKLVIGHAGDNSGWHALIEMVPAQRDALIVLTNGDAGPALREYLARPWSELVDVEPRMAAYRPPAALAVIGVLLDEGGAAAVTEYLRLSEEERASYQFEPGYLTQVADGLLRGGRSADAAELLALGVDLYTAAPDLWALFARAQHALGDAEGARAACDRALELEADHPWAIEVLTLLE